MNYFVKCLILGARQMQMYPMVLRSELQAHIDNTLNLAKNRSEKEKISKVAALDKIIVQRYLGLILMFIATMTSLALTLYLVLQNYEWWISCLPLLFIIILYWLVIILGNVILKNEPKNVNL